MAYVDGYRAIVVGASGGIGQALVAQLQQDPSCADVVELSRRHLPGFDLTDEASIKAAADGLKQDGRSFDLIFDATGALQIDGTGPEKSLKMLDPQVMARQFAVNAIGPALLLKHFAPLLPRDRPSAFATLSARVGSIGDNRLGGWISYRAAKSALNQIVRTAAVELARTHPISVVVALHPGTVETSLSAGFRGNHQAMPPASAAAQLLSVLSGLRPEQTGGFFAYDGSEIVW